ncbi:hypothetical protein Trydic_g8702 [Trypoxylus dichotomus]
MRILEVLAKKAKLVGCPNGLCALTNIYLRSRMIHVIERITFAELNTGGGVTKFGAVKRNREKDAEKKEPTKKRLDDRRCRGKPIKVLQRRSLSSSSPVLLRRSKRGKDEDASAK